MNIKNLGFLVFFFAAIISLTVCVAFPANSQELTLDEIYDTTTFGSSDPSGLSFFPDKGNLLLSDSEIEETPYFTGDNLFELTPSISVSNTYSTLNFSREPTGVVFNTVTGTLFITDDNQDKVFEVNPLAPENVVSSFSTLSLGCNDPEGITFDPDTGNLFIADGTAATVFEVTTSGLLESSFAVPNQINDPEGIYFDICSENFFIVQGGGDEFIFEVTINGLLVNTFDLRPFGVSTPKGITFAPSNDTDISYIFVADYGNDEINDGRIFKLSLDGRSFCSNTLPQIDSGPISTPASIFDDETAQLSVQASDADGDSLTFMWTPLSGNGTINGSGNSVTYMPPVVTLQQTFTITVRVSDGKSGSVTGSVDVAVFPR
jgi:DNA-binding beta-propeller fold protein YncE